MNRRSTIKNLLTASGALLTFPAWTKSWNAKTLIGYRSSYLPKEQELLSAVADTILPSSPEKMGARSVGVDVFLQKLFDKCYEPEVNLNIKTQLLNLESIAMNTYNASFAACTQEQRISLLQRLGSSENKNEKDFFNLVKSETIRGFNTSEPVMTLLKYKVAPGHYYGCVDVNA